MEQLKLSRGFTIVELIVVVVVIGILAAVGMVSYNGVQQNARDKSLLSDIDAVGSEVTRYATKNSGIYGNAVKWYSGGAANSNISFTPSEGNVIDVVATRDYYCVRGFNPRSNHKTIQTAASKGSEAQACLLLDASTAAGGTDGEIGGWWKLNGNTVDSSGNNRHGVAQGASGTTPTPTVGQNGSAGGAYSFSSTINQWIQTNYNFPYSRLTVSVWAKGAGATVNSYGALLSNARDCCAAYNGFQIHYNASLNQIGTRLWWGATSSSNLAYSSFTANTWRHVVLTYDGSATRLYIDGTQVSSANLVQNPGSSAYNVSIGKGGWSSNSYTFGGDMDDARVYNYALSAADVQEMYKLGAQ